MILLITILLLLAGPGPARNSQQNFQLVFDGYELKEEQGLTVIELGVFELGKPVVLNLRLVNQAQSALVISNVRSSCGVSLPTWPRRPLEKGQEGLIVVNYDGSRPGKFSRNLVIYSNAHNNSLILEVRGEVKPLLP